MKNALIDQLFALGAVQFGSFTLKSGLLSPVYIDLRLLVSSPKLLRDIAGALVQQAAGLGFQRVAAIPYTALPIGTAFSLASGIPMIYPRKETKGYGTKKRIEGIYHRGETVLVLDDLITRGHSKFEVIAPLEAVGLRVKDIVVLIDREQGGKELLAQQGYRLHAILSIYAILERLYGQGKIDSTLYHQSLSFLKESGTPSHKAQFE